MVIETLQGLIDEAEDTIIRMNERIAECERVTKHKSLKSFNNHIPLSFYPNSRGREEGSSFATVIEGKRFSFV